MALTAVGKIEIDGPTFYEWVKENHPEFRDTCVAYGKPVWNSENQQLEIEFAMSTDTDPTTWADKPAFLK